MTQINITLNDELLKDLFLSQDTNAMKILMEKVFNAVLNAQAEAQIGAELYERSDERQTYRNGYRPRQLKTRVGSLNLLIPKFRNGHFSTQLFERYQRNEKALVLTMMEMVIQGVSTRKVSDITEELCGTGFSAGTVSNLCANLDPIINEFKNRPLTKEYPFVIADAIYMKMRKDHRIRSVALHIAIGICKEGTREIIGWMIDKGESKSSWSTVFKSLKERGLKGVDIVTSDAHCGIEKAISQEFIGSSWQRCQTHFSKNCLDKCPASLKDEFHAALTDMYNAPTIEECRKRRDIILDQYSESASSACEVLESGFDDITTIYSIPEKYRKRLRTSNMIERLNEELRRRERVIRIFPNEDSLNRLMGAVLLDIHEDWANKRRYMVMDDYYASLSEDKEPMEMTSKVVNL